MNLGFLDKKGTRQFKNVLKYLYDPNSITNPSQKTKISKEEFRKETIISSFKNLTVQDKQLLIVTIKDATNIVDEIINAFEHFKTLDENESIAIFLQNLMEEVDDNNTKLKIFNIIYLNHPTNAITILNETKSPELIKELYESVASSNPERAYIYALLNDVNINTKNPLDTEKLIDEINYIQSFSNDMILEMIAKDYDDLDNLINQINNRIKNRDFQMFYTLGKNIDLLSSYSINVDKSELSLLKWFIDITDKDGENDFTQKVMKKDIEPYSTQWLVFLSMNLLQMDIENKNLQLCF